MDPKSHPWAALEQAATETRTPCGAGEMIWRSWGRGEPLVLLHGGAGSWLHWLPTVAAFRDGRRVLAPDLPGLGHSADLTGEAAADPAAVVAAGLDTLFGDDTAVDLVGFSFGGVVAAMVAARRPVRSVTLVGSGGLGVIRATARLERVRDKHGAARDEANRTNLHRWMIADPTRIDAAAIAIQDWNSRHARFDSRPFGNSARLLDVLPGLQCRLAGIWGAHDHAVQGETARPHAALERIRPGLPFHVVPDAGHWVAYEAPDAFSTTLRQVLPAASTERIHEHA